MQEVFHGAGVYRERRDAGVYRLALKVQPLSRLNYYLVPCTQPKEIYTN